MGIRDTIIDVRLEKSRTGDALNAASGSYPQHKVFASPSHTSEKTQADVETRKQQPDYQEFTNHVSKAPKRFGLRYRGHKETTGKWQNDLEPSAVVHVSGPTGNAKRYAEHDRTRYNQIAVIHWKGHVGGEHALHTLHGVTDVDHASETMKAHNFPGGVFEKHADGTHDLHIVSWDPKDHPRVQALGATLNAPHSTVTGTATMLEDKKEKPVKRGWKKG